MEPEVKQNLPEQTFFRDSAIYVSATVLSSAITFITLPVYTRYLSPADYGIVALFVLFGNVSAGLLSFGLGDAIYILFSFEKNPEGFKILNSTNVLFIMFVYLRSGIFMLYRKETDPEVNGALCIQTAMGGNRKILICPEFCLTRFGNDILTTNNTMDKYAYFMVLCRYH